MRSVSTVAALALVLGAGPAFAQAGQQRPAQRPAQPTQQPRPAQPAGQAPAPQQPAPAPQPPAPFPEGAKLAIVNLQQIAQLSTEGKAAAARIQALIAKKQTEAAAKQKQLQDNQTKLAQGGALLSEAARDQLQKDIDKQTVDNQRFEQDAQQEVNELQTQLQSDFQRKLIPVLAQLAQDKGLHMLVSAQDAGAIWVAPGLDLTLEAVKRFDAATQPTAKPAAPSTAAPAQAPAPAPAAPPAAPATPKQ